MTGIVSKLGRCATLLPESAATLEPPIEIAKVVVLAKGARPDARS